MGPDPTDPPRPSWWAALPLLLLAGLVVLGLGIEAAVYGRLLWVSKLPVALLLAAAAVQAVRRREPRQ
jgi:hypothetical protein